MNKICRGVPKKETIVKVHWTCGVIIKMELSYIVLPNGYIRSSCSDNELSWFHSNRIFLHSLVFRLKTQLTHTLVFKWKCFVGIKGLIKIFIEIKNCWRTRSIKGDLKIWRASVVEDCNRNGLCFFKSNETYGNMRLLKATFHQRCLS